MNVVQIPTRANVDAAWDRYATLVRELHADGRRAADVDFLIQIARAFAVWRDIFLALDAEQC